MIFNIDNICFVGVKVQMHCLLAPSSQIECAPMFTHIDKSHIETKVTSDTCLIGPVDDFHFKEPDSVDSLRNSFTAVMERVF